MLFIFNFFPMIPSCRYIEVFDLPAGFKIHRCLNIHLGYVENYCMIINSDIQYFQHKTILFIWLRKIYDYGKVSHLK